MTTTVTLHTLVREKATLEDAARAVGASLGQRPCALFYGRCGCRFAVWENGAFAAPSPADAQTVDVYEARVFGERAELRWRNDPEGEFGRGQAALMAEQPVDMPDWKELAPLENLTRLPGAYLLWGKALVHGEPLPAGWSWIAAARVGKLAVPVAGLQAEERVRLRRVEYAGVPRGAAGAHGNAAVVEERLVGFRILAARANSDPPRVPVRE